MAAETGNLLARALARLERLASRPLGALVLFGCGLAVYAVRAIAWPLKAGRDLDEYLYAYIQLFDADVLLPWSMLFRTPVTPVVAGLSLDVAGGALAAVLFAASVVAWCAAGVASTPAFRWNATTASTISAWSRVRRVITSFIRPHVTVSTDLAASPRRIAGWWAARSSRYTGRASASASSRPCDRSSSRAGSVWAA